jgi:ribonuclease HI
MASKALIVANALRSLGNIVRGVNPYLMQQAVTACVLRKVYYGAETWWPGRTRPGSRKDLILNLVQGHLDEITKVILAGARAVLPVYRTTPTPVLHRESGLLPAAIELDYLATTATTRLRRLDPYHPLRKRGEGITRTGLQTSRFARRVLALPESEQLDPLKRAPWLPQEAREAAYQRIKAPTQTKRQAARVFQEFYSSLPETDIKVFTDGSKLANGMAGAGFAIYQSGRQFLQSSIPLGPNKEVFDAEAEAALAGAKAAFQLHIACYATNLLICLDNLEVATRLLSPFTGLSQEVFESFRALAKNWPARERFPYTDGGSVRICWVPGHTQIPENEAADQAAKKGAAMNPPPSKHSYASLKRRAKMEMLSVLQRY